MEDYNQRRDNFTVSKTHSKDIAGLPFSQLSEEDKQRFLNYEFSVHIIPANVDDRDVIQIFRRMNSTNFTLKKQELLNAQYFGEFKTSQYDLAAEQLERWRDWKTFTEDDIARMQEVEMTSEISITIIEQKILGKSPALIENYYKKFDETYPNRDEIEKRIRNIMDFIHSNFPGNKNDFVFFKKTIFYTFFASCYKLLFGLQSSQSQSLTVKKLPAQALQNLKQKSDRIKERSAPQNVLEATDRRTTNIKEREILFEYLVDTNA